jgi:hypothetical protein
MQVVFISVGIDAADETFYQKLRCKRKKLKREK